MKWRWSIEDFGKHIVEDPREIRTTIDTTTLTGMLIIAERLETIAEELRAANYRKRMMG